EEVAELTSARESQARAAEQIRRRFVAEGGDAAMHRARTEAERDEVARRIGRCEHEVRDLAGKLLPFAVAPRLVASFWAALTNAGAGDARDASVQALRGALEAWRVDGTPPRRVAWSAEHWEDLARFLGAWAGRTEAGARTSPAFREVGDGAAALARLAEVEAVVRPRAAALLEELDLLTRRLRELDVALDRADSAASGVLLDELREAEQRVGSTEATLHARQEELRTVRGRQVALERERQRLLEEQAAAAAAEARAALARRTARALADYEHELLEHKLAQLRGEFARWFNHLARKGDLVAEVRIDPASFAATLVGLDGGEVPKAALSAGEKQVYAVAMLWALARTSGRPLPMIIDTPLARLDADHRANLIGRYFPAASHQVVLLSTDTEVDERLLADLGASVSHAYRLDYDAAAGRTVVVPGYFGGSVRPGEAIRALQQA
ncbi:MAG: DNA sulfur modification protein DndD, partial [Dehalococcoidia bacterium]